ncbi:MAG: CopG family transcriptional regulator [Suilimivivens sp.]
MARTGRPRLENPRSEGVFIRLTKREHTDITEYANNHNLTITQTLVQGFNKLREQESKDKNE